MKKIVFTALIVSFVFSLSISYQQIKNDEIEKLATLEKKFATPFVFPEHEGLADPEEVYPLLRKVATEAQVNLFRAGRYYRPDEQIEMLKYLLLTGETTFFDYVQLASGRILQIEETQNSKLFLSSIQTDDKKQVGRIQYFDPEQLITIKSLQTSYDYLPVHGRYFAEAKDNKQFQLFLKTLSTEINSYLSDRDGDKAHSYTPADLQPPEAFTQPQEDFFTLTDLHYLRYEQFILFAVTLFLLIYYIFNRAKQIGILKMHGLSNLRLWWIVVGRLIITAVGVTALGSVLFGLTLHEPVKFLAEAFLQLGLACLILTLLSLFCYVYIATIKVSQSIKNRKDTRGIFVLNVVLKVVSAVALILMGLETFAEYADLSDKQDQVHAQQEQLGNWGNMKDYGLVQAYAGHTTAYTLEEYEAELSKGDKVLFELYPFLSARGALYIDAGEYEQESLLSNSNFSGILSITVNPNYLKTFPVYDREGNPVQISEKTTDWVVLVPEKYKDREKEIRDYFEKDKESRKFYLTLDEGQKMKIIWLAEDQYIFSFNPDVFPSEENMILDPIIHIKTENNHLFTYRGGIQGKGLNDPLKLKLIDEDPKLTYEKLKPELKQLKLDDRIQVVSFHQSIIQKIDELNEDIQTNLLKMLGFAVVFMLLTVQNQIIFFHKHQQRFVVHRLFGIGFFKTYRPVFSWWALTSMAFVLLSFAKDRIEEPEFRMITGITDPHFLILVLSLFAIEILTTVIALTVMERRNQIQVIKGGD